jgi:hypothetical protein
LRRSTSDHSGTAVLPWRVALTVFVAAMGMAGCVTKETVQFVPVSPLEMQSAVRELDAARRGIPGHSPAKLRDERGSMHEVDYWTDLRLNATIPPNGEMGTFNEKIMFPARFSDLLQPCRTPGHLPQPGPISWPDSWVPGRGNASDGSPPTS